jgi:hypothetical protein
MLSPVFRPPADLTALLRYYCVPYPLPAPAWQPAPVPHYYAAPSYAYQVPPLASEVPADAPTDGSLERLAAAASLDAFRTQGDSSGSAEPPQLPSALSPVQHADGSEAPAGSSAEEIMQHSGGDSMPYAAAAAAASSPSSATGTCEAPDPDAPMAALDVAPPPTGDSGSDAIDPSLSAAS